jgi:hypothetical protein
MTDPLDYPKSSPWARFARLALAGALTLGVGGCSMDSDQTTSAGQEPSPSGAPSSYRVENGGRSLVDSGGTRIRVAPKLVTGYVDSAVSNGEYIDMSGWAAPADLGRPADAVVAVVGKKSVASAVPSGDRPDLVDGYDRPGLAKAGFVMSVPKSALDCSAPAQGLKTFAVVAGTAGSLKWLADVDEHVADAC